MSEPDWLEEVRKELRNDFLPDPRLEGFVAAVVREVGSGDPHGDARWTLHMLAAGYDLDALDQHDRHFERRGFYKPEAAVSEEAREGMAKVVNMLADDRELGAALLHQCWRLVGSEYLVPLIKLVARAKELAGGRGEII